MTAETKIEIIEGISGLMAVVFGLCLLVFIACLYGAVWGDSEFWGRVGATAAISSIPTLIIGPTFHSIAKRARAALTSAQRDGE